MQLLIINEVVEKIKEGILAKFTYNSREIGYNPVLFEKTMTHPVLYTFRRCPWAMRARIALHYAGVQCEVREVHLRNKPVALLEISPKATVPTLVLPNGTVIDESMDIIRYALQYHDPDGWHDADMADAERLLNIAEGDFMKVSHRYKYHDRFPDETLEDNRQKCEKLLLNDFETRLHKNQFLCGEKPSIADVGTFPLIRQFAAVDRAWWHASPYSNIQRWLDLWTKSPHYINVMNKRKPWQESDPIVMLL